MGLAKYITQTFQKEWKGTQDENHDYKSLMQKRTIEYRKEVKAVVKIAKPTNLASARQVGYKAKNDIIVARVRVRKGSGTYSRPKSKRRPKRQGQAKLTRRKSTRAMAEEKASKKFENTEVIGSYKIAEDGKSHYYEIVLADRDSSVIAKDKELAFLKTGQKGRAERGKTLAGKVNKETNKKKNRKYRKKNKVKNNHSK
ncbi:MAG: 50S ribosomal protein L15e [Candidatus Diapherotrites archaeon]|jgi:large subunit ribosomal protein L15e|uniref:50S ribosomal protein L15e n=1 Tax=Candidatus Iainarchaeum sp. TaxID=3101447 RepID=A0A8T5GDK6_9ARCH|nr:50S ribosomal protein L15e [Candidatus Diapherotrites archaeon]MBT7241702.1 50S ribosomal protein L15e [Candidatus Diapherotrites archaeon]